LEPAEWHRNVQFEWYRGYFIRLKAILRRIFFFPSQSCRSCNKILFSTYVYAAMLKNSSDVPKERTHIMEQVIKEVAARIKETRLICEVSEEEMAACTGVTVEAYRELEAGNADFTFTFIYKCAARFGVDTTDLLKGSSPTLEEFSITRKGRGLPIARRKGFRYENLAPLFKNKGAEPFAVLARYNPDEQNKPIKLSHHEGHEFNYVVSGKLKVSIDGHEDILEAGDSIYYDSAKPHGMIAVDGDCEFLALIIANGEAAYDYPDMPEDVLPAADPLNTLTPMPENPVAGKFVECIEENGS